jgi:hypothetical protein
MEHAKQERKNQPPKHPERGPGLRLLVRSEVAAEMWHEDEQKSEPRTGAPVTQELGP